MPSLPRPSTAPKPPAPPAPLVLYHAECDDGFGAAYAAWLSLGDAADYRPVSYGDAIPPAILPGRTVYILDFSFPPAVLGEMATVARNIILLDHHLSAAAQWDEVPPIGNVDVRFDMDRSGAQMAWDYFHPGLPRPALIDHIGDRDLWRFWLADTKAYCAGLSLIPTRFESWQAATSVPQELIAKGNIVLEVLQRQIDSALRKKLRPVTLCGIQGLATNAISNTSEIGQAIAQRSGTFSLTFFIKGDDVICSLRSIAPFADVEILEQHFREKPEVSGTARKIAESLSVDNTHITSLRLGGIVGHHEVIFGFPYQTVRLIHNSIERKAFGTGAAFALSELATCGNGFYTFDDLLMQKVRSQLAEG